MATAEQARGRGVATAEQARGRGVGRAEQARGRGVGRAVCGLVLDSLVADHGTAALIVDGWNTAAVRLYRGLGLAWRPLAAARVADR
ncbi:hypothetical protein ACIGXF_20870 [Streptomyces sp. NPDC053086]|uniref:hypothetical protein n=1 Tax=unclassified Streptomyces TaxID=2593676 RepID=UPI0037CE26B8